jgi:hypothetical protein
MSRIRLTDIAPDGVRIIVDWDKFTPGASVFIPAINTEKAVKHVLTASKLEKHEVKYRVRVEGGKYGVRIWRLI